MRGARVPSAGLCRRQGGAGGSPKIPNRPAFSARATGSRGGHAGNGHGTALPAPHIPAAATYLPERILKRSNSFWFFLQKGRERCRAERGEPNQGSGGARRASVDFGKGKESKRNHKFSPGFHSKNSGKGASSCKMSNMPPPSLSARLLVKI